MLSGEGGGGYGAVFILQIYGPLLPDVFLNNSNGRNISGSVVFQDSACTRPSDDDIEVYSAEEIISKSPSQYSFEIWLINDTYAHNRGPILRSFSN